MIVLYLVAACAATMVVVLGVAAYLLRHPQPQPPAADSDLDVVADHAGFRLHSTPTDGLFEPVTPVDDRHAAPYPLPTADDDAAWLEAAPPLPPLSEPRRPRRPSPPPHLSHGTPRSRYLRRHHPPDDD